MMVWRKPLWTVVALIACIGAGLADHAPGKLIFMDDFASGQQWAQEFETQATLRFSGGTADLVAAKGATLWFRPKLSGPVVIEYQIEAVSEGGPYDQVSDLNCFWMASDPRQSNFLKPPRSGKFEDYNALKTYYVGLGGNRNTTTRFRRYIGDPKERPLLPENDLKAPEALIQPNVWQTIRLVADNGDIRYYRDRRLLFHYTDPAPYTEGWFGFRTTQNHMRMRHFRVYRLGS